MRRLKNWFLRKGRRREAAWRRRVYEARGIGVIYTTERYNEQDLTAVYIYEAEFRVWTH